MWNKAAMQELLATNDKAVVKALVAIYDRQTEAEKANHTTQEHNGIGFSGVDAEILTSFVEFYKKTGFLSPKQMAIARNKVKKYWKQLLQLAAANGKEVSYK